LGQELTARVQFTGAIRKRVMPIMLMDLNMELPRPWLMASQVQQGKTPNDITADLRGEDNQNNDNNNSINKKAMAALPRLPRLSPSAVGSIIGMMSGGAKDTVDGDNQEEKKDDTEAKSAATLAAQSKALMEGLQQGLKVGDKMVDSSDGKTIGQIIALPEPGTNVVLAQVRLDKVGLLGEGVWTHTNKVKVGELGEFRYLPYLPLWWPEIDRESGKAKVVTDDDEEEDKEELD
jgi:transferase CAF17, mitochondrial